jgi:molybdate transport system substrate-binding protein
MARMLRFTLTACLLLAQSFATPSFAAERVLVAVASNFLPTARSIAEAFEADTGIDVRLSSASSGKLYAQIVNGAPYDVFLSADAALPARLEADGVAVAGSRFTYALGQLVLWSGDASLAEADCRVAFENDTRSKLAIANADFAPYGRAAREFLERSGLSAKYAGRLVVGENIAQTAAFALTGGARFGLLAASQLDKLPTSGCLWRVPADLHAPIEQQAVLLERAADRSGAARFLAYLASDARATIAAAGYELADD